MAEEPRAREARRGVALVGAGHWGGRLARNLGASPLGTLRWVCDTDRGRAAAVGEPLGARITDTVADVLGDPAVEAVALATPAATHEDLVAACLDAGRHVLVEKPLARSVAAAEALAAAARARGLVLMCDHTYRFAPAVAAIRSLVADRALGALVAVDSVRTNHQHGQPDLDVLWDLAHHDLSILAAVLLPAARPVAVRATRADRAGTGREHAGALTLDLAGGATAHVRVDWWAPEKVRTSRFTGTEGALDWDDLDPSGPRLTLTRAGAAPRPIPLEAREPLAGVVHELLAAIDERRAPVCGADEEIAVLRILEAATTSAAAAGARVPLTEVPGPVEVAS